MRTHNESEEALVKRLEKYKLKLNEEKTKQIPFDKRLVSSRSGTRNLRLFRIYILLGKSKIREGYTETEDKS